jgi:sterol desaturase/sphingolipid hydroxylase (fatty acid hydroxylase superfamily)
MGDAPNHAAFALPIFTAAVIAEILVARRRGRVRELYSVGTAVSDVGCGAVFQAAEVLLTLLTFALYSLLWEHARLVTWPEGSPWPWVIGLLGVDFLYYWWHRTSHVVNVMWAVHGVHHQSEDYNLAVALRQPLLEPITWFLFASALALAGVPLLVMVVSFGLNLFYQFWIHTELVGKLPWPIEAVLNTPSHHRVHHGVDPEYLDRNYGGVLVIWDRLFGTFQVEKQRPTYGTTIPLRSYNPLWSNWQHLHRCWRLCRAAPRLRDKLWVLLAHPAWLPQGVTEPDAKPDRAHYGKYRPALGRRVSWYVLLNLGLVASVAGPFVFVGHALPVPQIVAGVVVLVLSHVALNGIVEGKAWASSLDWARIVGVAAVAGWLCGTVVGPAIGIAAAGALLMVPLASRALLRPRAVVPASAQ